MTATRSVLAVALLVLLAGCGGVFGGDGGDGGDASTTAPTTTAPTTTTATPGGGSVVDSYPDGVTDDGLLTNVSALVAGHDATLADASYRAELRLEQVQSDGDQRSERVTEQTVRVGDGGYRTDLVTERTGSPTFNATAWSNGTVAVRQVYVGDQPRYQQLPAEDFVAQLSGERTLSGYIELGNYTVERVTGTDGETLVTLTADEYAGSGAGAEIETFESTLVVDGDGRIREYDLRVRTVSNGTTVTVDFHYEVATVGGVTVEKPGWVGNALAAGSDGS